MHFCTSAHEELPGGCVDQKRKQTRQGKLDMAVATIQRRYGPWSLVKGRPPRLAGDLAAVPHIPTGFSRLDQALGIGGLPLGRICELLGPATSGKTTLALKLLAHAQASGGQVAYIDQALYFDQDYAYRCGLDLSRLWVGKPYDLQEALAMAENLARSGGLAAAVLDLLDFLWTDPSASSLLLATLDRLPALLDRSGTTLLILHESWQRGSSALSAMAHYASVRLYVVRERWIHHHGDIRGYEARVEIAKNRLAPAGRTVCISIEFNGTVHGNGL
jgi:recombination protein RecA